MEIKYLQVDPELCSFLISQSSYGHIQFPQWIGRIQSIGDFSCRLNRSSIKGTGISVQDLLISVPPFFDGVLSFKVASLL